MPERLARSLSGGPFGSKHLPWDISKILSVDGFPPAVGGWDAVSVCAKGVAAVTRRDAGTSGTAKTRNV
jgi:hypothetical protein